MKHDLLTNNCRQQTPAILSTSIYLQKKNCKFKAKLQTTVNLMSCHHLVRRKRFFVIPIGDRKSVANWIDDRTTIVNSIGDNTLSLESATGPLPIATLDPHYPVDIPIGDKRQSQIGMTTRGYSCNCFFGLYIYVVLIK